jgi:L-threonylcarbamoyladenylate synthase
MLKTDLSKAIESLENGEVIVYPTDTQYAFGADISNEDSIKKVFKIKNRPFNDPLPIAVAKYSDILQIAYTHKYLETLVNHFLPGKLTIILYKKDNISSSITGGLDKIAIRIPDNKIALKLISKFGPLTLTSANIHGKKTESSIENIYSQFKGHINCYLDYGVLNNNPSTIIDLTPERPTLIREGEILIKDILAVI